MVHLVIALQQELGAPEQTQLGKLYSFKDEKARYLKNYIVWDAIERANLAKLCREKAKYLSKDAQAIVALVIQKLEKGERVFLNHRYISLITKCKRRQNQNIIKQLAAVFDIKYHNSVTHNEKKYRYSYEFSYKQQEQENISSVEHSTESSIGQFIARQTAPVHIYIKNKDIEDIDLQSNFLQNSESKNQEEVSTAKIINFPTRIKKRLPNQRRKTTNSEIKAKVISLNKYPRQYNTPKTLAEHYPLNQEDCAELQSKSGREFSLNAMNEILLDMSRKPKESQHKFPSKAAFMAYMEKALQGEMRDAVKTANLNFKILTRATEPEVIEYISQAEQESFFATIENEAISNRNDETQYKAKLVNTMPLSQVYNFVSSMKTVRKVGAILEITMNKQIELTELAKEILLVQANAVGGYSGVERLEFVMK